MPRRPQTEEQAGIAGSEGAIFLRAYSAKFLEEFPIPPEFEPTDGSEYIKRAKNAAKLRTWAEANVLDMAFIAYREWIHALIVRNNPLPVRPSPPGDDVHLGPPPSPSDPEPPPKSDAPPDPPREP